MSGRPMEYRVAWKRAHWQAHGMSYRHYETLNSARRFATDLQNRPGELSVLRIEVREVGDWQSVRV